MIKTSFVGHSVGARTFRLPSVRSEAENVSREAPNDQALTLFYPPVNFLISFNFINASTGVKVLMSIVTNSSRICSNTGSFN